jgi:hypothetical protein
MSQEAATSTRARSMSLASKGIRNSEQFTSLMGALMSDVLEGKITPQVANATCNAAGKMLKEEEKLLTKARPEESSSLRSSGVRPPTPSGAGRKG